MSGHDPIILKSEIRSQLEVLESLYVGFEDLLRQEFAQLGKTRGTALMVAGIIENYYTCAETLFLRVSHYFENNLDEKHWHRDLLFKMQLSIADIRIPVINQETFLHLQELLRFRHFKRYYYQLDYDWDQLDFLVCKLKKVHPLLTANVQAFVTFLDSLIDSLE